MLRSPYRKEWYVGTSIAKGFIGMELGSRIPTITDYSEVFNCSRGIVQNALTFLEDKGAVVLDKQGKKGTFISERDEESLFRYSGLTHLNASMPPPINLHFAGLATGICSGMSRCPVPFTFAFVQGSENRLHALRTGAYDFVVTTKNAAAAYAAKNPDVEIAIPFEGSEYALPYKLYVNKPGKTELEDGMVVAVDPTSGDHMEITRRICQGRNVIVKEMPLISAATEFYTGGIDCFVFRDGMESSNHNLLKILLQNKNSLDPGQISRIPIEEAGRDMQLPVALTLRSNYGMAGILKKYLPGEEVGSIQKQVLSGSMVPQFY